MRLNHYSFFANQDVSHHTDVLTGLLDKELLYLFVNDLIANETPFTYLLIDFDDFKKVNDSLGHQMGDQALKDVAKVFDEYVGEKGVVGRYGGDEFAIVLPSVSDYQQVWSFTHDLLQHFRSIRFPYLAGVFPFSRITLTCGIARYPLDGDDYDEIIANADRALYRGKNKGKNCFIIYLPQNFRSGPSKEVPKKKKLSEVLHEMALQFQEGRTLPDIMTRVGPILASYTRPTFLSLIGKKEQDFVCYRSDQADLSYVPIPFADLALLPTSDHCIYYKEEVYDTTPNSVLSLSMTEGNIHEIALFRIRIKGRDDLFIRVDQQRTTVWSDDLLLLYSTLADFITLFFLDGNKK